MQCGNGFLHAFQRGGHQRRKPHKTDALLPYGVNDRLHGHIAPKVDHVKAIIFKYDLYDVFADVMYIPFDGGKHDAPLACARTAFFCDDGFDLLKGALCGAGSLQQLRQKQLALLVLCAHDVQCGDQCGVYQFKRVLLLQQGLGAGGRLALQAFFHSGHQGGIRTVCGRQGIVCRGVLHSGGLRRLCQCRRGRDAVGVALDVFCALPVAVGQHVVGIHGSHHLLAGGVHDGKVEPGVHRHGQKGSVQVGAAGQTEADV